MLDLVLALDSVSASQELAWRLLAQHCLDALVRDEERRIRLTMVELLDLEARRRVVAWSTVARHIGLILLALIKVRHELVVVEGVRLAHFHHIVHLCLISV